MSSIGTAPQKSFERLLRAGNAAAAILWTQLCTEHLLNQLVKEKLPNGEAMVNDPRTYSFAIKLVSVRNKELLPENLCENIRRLNDLRDQYARDLDYQPSDEDLELFDPEEGEDLAGELGAWTREGLLTRLRRALFGRLSDAETRRLRRMWALTVVWLQKYCTT